MCGHVWPVHVIFNVSVPCGWRQQKYFIIIREFLLISLFPVKYQTFGPTGLMGEKERDLGGWFSLRECLQIFWFVVLYGYTCRK